VATAAASPPGERHAPGWTPWGQPVVEGKPRAGRNQGVKRCAKR
jgi:hypothetical protein